MGGKQCLLHLGGMEAVTNLCGTVSTHKTEFHNADILRTWRPLRSTELCCVLTETQLECHCNLVNEDI
jgi:hypothetical protein